jgi:hypothetical protein
MSPIAFRVVVASALVCALIAPLRAEETPGFDPQVARRIKPEEVQRRQEKGEKAVIIDTRSSVGNLIAKGAVQVPNDRLEAWAKDIPKDALIVAYCT